MSAITTEDLCRLSRSLRPVWSRARAAHFIVAVSLALWALIAAGIVAALA